MKQIIILSATIPILLVIMLQFSLEQVKHSRNLAMENALHEYRMAASLDFDNLYTETDKLQSKLANIYNVSTKEIHIILVPNDIDKSAIYSISIPISKIMAGAEFMNLKDNKNVGTINIQDEIFAVAKETETETDQ